VVLLLLRGTKKPLNTPNLVHHRMGAYVAYGEQR